MAAGRNAFGEEWLSNRVAIAPGRIELLGNHLDYNGGPVLAAAIDRWVVTLSAPFGADGTISATFANEGAAGATLVPTDLLDWQNPVLPPESLDYVRGVIAANAVAYPVSQRLSGPLSLAIAGDVPIGLGLSSSAALCVSLTLALADERPDPSALCLLAQEAEHRAGTPCGTMDQSTSIAGGAILFDGSTLTVKRLAPVLTDVVFVVVDSGVRRSLATSSYPFRVKEAQAALARVNAHLSLDLRNLASMTAENLEDALRMSNLLMPEPLKRRLRHIVSETERVIEGTEALKSSDWSRFGLLMSASGRSSALDYEISHPKVEELIEEMRAIDGVLGARMMGGGEGGAVLALVQRQHVTTLRQLLRSGYFLRYAMDDRADLVHECVFSNGASMEVVS